jgi:hypothetical protein
MLPRPSANICASFAVPRGRRTMTMQILFLSMIRSEMAFGDEIQRFGYLLKRLLRDSL